MTYVRQQNFTIMKIIIWSFFLWAEKKINRGSSLFLKNPIFSFLNRVSYLCNVRYSILRTDSESHISLFLGLATKQQKNESFSIQFLHHDVARILPMRFVRLQNSRNNYKPNIFENSPQKLQLSFDNMMWQTFCQWDLSGYRILERIMNPTILKTVYKSFN